MITEEQKAEIDSLTFEELSDELLMQSSSRFHGAAHDYVLARYARLESDREGKKHKELFELHEKRVRIAEEANKLSKIAIWVSVFAFLIALFGLASDFKLNGKGSNE
jgi:hypothetical protein